MQLYREQKPVFAKNPTRQVRLYVKIIIAAIFVAIKSAKLFMMLFFVLLL